MKKEREISQADEMPLLLKKYRRLKKEPEKSQCFNVLAAMLLAKMWGQLPRLY